MNDKDPPMIRQILVDLNGKEFCLHASGTEPRADVYCSDPVIYGTVVSVKTNIKSVSQQNRGVKYG